MRMKTCREEEHLNETPNMTGPTINLENWEQ